jgi:hypothetical protein
MSAQHFSSPFDFSSPFGINDNNNTFFTDTTKAEPYLHPPPNYASVCNGTTRSFPINNQHKTKNPPPGLVHPSHNDQKLIYATIVQALENELSDVKAQLVNLSKINEKIGNIENLLSVLRKIIGMNV